MFFGLNFKLLWSQPIINLQRGMGFFFFVLFCLFAERPDRVREGSLSPWAGERISQPVLHFRPSLEESWGWPLYSILHMGTLLNPVPHVLRPKMTALQGPYCFFQSFFLKGQLYSFFKCGMFYPAFLDVWLQKRFQTKRFSKKTYLFELQDSECEEFFGGIKYFHIWKLHILLVFCPARWNQLTLLPFYLLRLWCNLEDNYCVCVCVCVRVLTQSCLTLCDPMDCSPPGSSVEMKSI